MGVFLEREFLRWRTSCEGEIEYIRVEGEISSCNISFLIVKFACPVEASPFLTDARILIIFCYISSFFLLHLVVPKRS